MQLRSPTRAVSKTDLASGFTRFSYSLIDLKKDSIHPFPKSHTYYDIS